MNHSAFNGFHRVPPRLLVICNFNKGPPVGVLKFVVSWQWYLVVACRVHVACLIHGFIVPWKNGELFNSQLFSFVLLYGHMILWSQNPKEASSSKHPKLPVICMLTTMQIQLLAPQLSNCLVTIHAHQVV